MAATGARPLSLRPAPASAPPGRRAAAAPPGGGRRAPARRARPAPPAAAAGPDLAAMARAAAERLAGGGGPLAAAPGAPAPLGASPAPGGGVNFALAAPAATSVTLVLRDAAGAPLLEAPLARAEGAPGVWAAAVPRCPRRGVLYSYKVDGPPSRRARWHPARELLDPYAPLVAGRARFGRRDAFEAFAPGEGSTFRGTFDFEAPPFDWGARYAKPGHAAEDLVALELPVRAFTAAPASGVPEAARGTFAGVAAKAAHLKALGVNAVELLPVFE
jgi:isoamylase